MFSVYRYIVPYLGGRKNRFIQPSYSWTELGMEELEGRRRWEKVGEISNKVRESRLKWYGHVLRREDEYVGKRERDGDGGAGKRRRGRPKRMWLDNIGNDLGRENCNGRMRKTCVDGGVS